MRPDTSAGQDFDFIGGLGYQLPDKLDSFGDGFLLATREDACDTKGYQLVKCLERVGGDIEGPMEYDVPTAGEFDDLPATPGIDGTVFGEYSEDKAVGTMFKGQFSIAEHYGHFGLGIAKSACSGANHDHYGDFQSSFGFYY
jgi:hypothetical protein